MHVQRKDLLLPARKMPEAANIAPVSPDLPAGPGFSNMPDHILSILTCLVDGFLAWGLDGIQILSGYSFIAHVLRILCNVT